MLLAEVLALIAVEPMQGETRSKLEPLHRQDVLTAALLMELAVQSRIGLKDQRVVVLDTLPSRHMLLTACLRSVEKHSGLLRADQMMDRVARELAPLREDLLEGLARRDVLHQAVHRFKWFGRKRYPVRSTQAQGECLKQFNAATIGVDSSMAGLAMLALGCATGAVDHLLTFEQAEESKARLRELHTEISEALSDETNSSDEFYSMSLLEALSLALERRLNH